MVSFPVLCKYQYSKFFAFCVQGTIGNLGDFEEIIGEATGGGNVIMAIKIANGEDVGHFLNYCDFLGFLGRYFTNFRIKSASLSWTCLISVFLHLSSLTHHFLLKLRIPPFFQHCIVGIGPRECLVYGDEGECPFSGKDRPKKLSALLRKVGVLETSGANVANTADWVEVQNIFRPGSEVDSLSDSLKRCLCGLYNYLKMDEQEAYMHKFSLSTYRTSGFMHIDAGAVRALELFALNYHQGNRTHFLRRSFNEHCNCVHESHSTLNFFYFVADAKGTSGTVYGLLNKCRSAPGQRLLSGFPRFSSN
ncbi:unnamed protein product [Haemonchus placei]|uniref:Pentatricopeptide repeat-containing protein n=1 Tax=Haemonchus placei TaxID=6290 RepID=A0A0N4W325_HAEPC|nr:unnamed protein product [Haemonchus placei]